MATPVVDERDSPQAKQRETDQAIEQALAESPVLQTADGLIVEQSATGGYILSSPDSLRHKLAAMNEAEAAAIADYKRKWNVS